jgi:predicted nucleic acid-binding protein
MGYLIDSNVISNFTLVKFPEKAMNFLANVFDEIPNISVITKIEVLSWRSDTVQDEVKIISFVSSSNVIPLFDNIVNKCIDIRRNGKIKTPDAVIAATAMIFNLTLVTGDAGFGRIPNLKILNPFNLQF